MAVIDTGKKISVDDFLEKHSEILSMSFMQKESKSGKAYNYLLGIELQNEKTKRSRMKYWIGTEYYGKQVEKEYDTTKQADLFPSIMNQYRDNGFEETNMMPEKMADRMETIVSEVKKVLLKIPAAVDHGSKEPRDGGKSWGKKPTWSPGAAATGEPILAAGPEGKEEDIDWTSDEGF